MPDVNTSSDAEERDLEFMLILARVRSILVREKINWMQIFAMFDRKGDGVLGQ